MTLDAIIIADAGSDTFSGTNPLKLTVDGYIADIQTVKNFLANDGQVTPPVKKADQANWAATPKLNGIYLQSYLAKYDFKVKLINSYYEQRDLFRQLLTQSPRAILISTTFIVDKLTLTKLTADIRSLSPNIPVIVGGPYICLSHGILERTRTSGYLGQKHFKGHLFLDIEEEPRVDLYIISSRGESIAREALYRLQRGKNFDDLPNTAVWRRDGYCFSKRSDDRQDPIPPIDWLQLEDHIFQSGMVPMQASNGCPYKCAFCNFVKDPKMARVKPIEELIDEIKQVHQRGARYIWFIDDNFRLGKGDLEAFCRRLIDADLGVFWMTFIRASVLENIDPELLRKAGCIEVQLGLESADPQILKNMNKKASPQLYAKVVNQMLAAGINCSCYLIFGFPGETEASAQRTLDFMKQYDNRLDGGTISWSLFPFILAPLSPIYEPEARKRYGMQGHLRKWRHATMDAAQALQLVKKAFFAMESSGPIYRNDNQDILRSMPAQQKNAFHRIRHQLAKKAISAELTKQDIYQAFTSVLQ